LTACEAPCPHLGAHLGAGNVVGESLRCAFHGFEFNTGGRCVSTPYGPAPRARLTTLAVQEAHDLILLPHGLRPDECLPAVPQRDHQWRPTLMRCWRFRGHPQEVTENAVDLGHLKVLHRFRSLRSHAPVVFDGRVLRAGYSLERPILAGLRTRAQFSVYAWGLGFSYVGLTVPRLGIQARQFILPTPVNATTIDLRLAISMDKGHRGSHLAAPVVERILFAAVAIEVRRDIAIWKDKFYLEHPHPSRDDGPIGPYRRWARQFYENGEHPPASKYAG